MRADPAPSNLTTQPGAVCDCQLSIVLPCLNEAATIESCIIDAAGAIAALGVRGEVLVVDNGSIDASARRALRAGARVIHTPTRGYGAALRAGIDAAYGEFVVIADADATYDLTDLSAFWRRLQAGADLVIGDRFAGGLEPGVMPFWNQHVGNPLLSGLARTLFASPVRDFHCGLRGFRRQSIIGLELRADGMEFATEMVATAALANLVIDEVPTTLRGASSERRSHLRPLRDGVRHLAVMTRLRIVSRRSIAARQRRSVRSTV